MLAEHENIYNTSDLERAMNLQQILTIRISCMQAEQKKSYRLQNI